MRNHCRVGGIRILVSLILAALACLTFAGAASAQEVAEPAAADVPAESVTAPAENATEPVESEPEGAQPAGEAETEPAEAPASEPVAPEEAETQPAASEPAGEPTTAPGEEKAALDVLADHFAQYLHFALIGQFDLADKHAEALLKLPDLNPLSPAAADRLVALTSQDEYKDAIDILLLLINNTSIADNAQKVLDHVRQAHRRQRMNPARINESLRLLAGTPTQQMVGLERLRDSGEYAVPWMLEALADPKQADLHPFITRAMPQLGKRILNPLVEALAIGNPNVQRIVAEALGRIGYPQALAYLKRAATDAQANSVVRQAAAAAVGEIVLANPAAADLPAAELLARLAELYYAGEDSLRPDPREPATNVWFAREGTVHPVEVPREIFMLVMCMRCCEASLALAKDRPAVVALWLAADFRREARLGLDVQNDAVVETADLTRPKNFLRGVYFARAAGPMHCLLVLQRATRDLDRDVALGAIAALHATAGPAAMVGASEPNGLSLSSALRFPDLLVRLRAALALGRALPAEPFAGHDEVVPILASALGLKGEKFYLLVDPDGASRRAIADGLSRSQATVVEADRFGAGLAQARRELTHLDGVFLASDLAGPTLIEVLRQLAQDNRFALAPVVAYIKEGGNLVADQVAAADKRVGRVLVTTGAAPPGADFAATLLDKWAKVAPAYGYGEVGADLSVQLAMEAAGVLRDIAISGRTVLDAGGAEKALIAALSHPAEPLRIACTQVLARINTSQAQQAIAAVALSDDASVQLRKVAFAALAESARQFGSKLDGPMTGALTGMAFGEPNLELRTAASRALGTLNLPGGRVADIILGQK